MKIALALVLTASPVASNTVPALPPAIAARIADDEKGCPAGSARIEQGFITRKDVNGDKIADYVLDYGFLKCGSTRGFCGSGGCTIVVFASYRGRFVKVIDDLAARIDFKTIKGRPAAVMVYPGSACGKDPCLDIRIWNGTTFKSKP